MEAFISSGTRDSSPKLERLHPIQTKLSDAGLGGATAPRSATNATVAPNVPHSIRMRAMLKAHPELRGLLGTYRPTMGWIALLFFLQIGLAWASGGKAWWEILILAYAVGSFLSLGLWTLIHECTHDLVLSSSGGNRWLGILAGLPLVIPAAAAFRRFHLMHHRYLGHPVLDGDVPSAWEVRLVQNCPLRKALWLSCGAIFQALRPLRMPGLKPTDSWTLVNAGSQTIFNGMLVILIGCDALAYLLLSNIFALGLHPLGARWIQEHFVLREGQETYSYYGPLNRLLFNAGYHTEHHDLMRVPWIRLPEVRILAPEFYRGRQAYRSWTVLLGAFVFKRELTLDLRILARGPRP